MQLQPHLVNIFLYTYQEYDEFSVGSGEGFYSLLHHSLAESVPPIHYCDHWGLQCHLGMYVLCYLR